MNSEHLYFNAFNLLPQIGPVRFQKLLNFFPSLAAAWHASESELLESGVEQQIVAAILDHRQKTDVEAEFSKLEKYGIFIIIILLYFKILDPVIWAILKALTSLLNINF